MALLLAMILVGGSFTARADTLVEVRPGDRLVLDNFTGEVSVEVWDRPQMSLSGETDGSARFGIRRTEDRVSVTLENGRGRRRRGDLRVVVPAWMAVELSGRELEARIRGVTGDVTVRSLEGDLSFRGLGGSVDAYTMEGTIEAFDFTGPAHLRTGDDDLRVVDCTGPLDLETVDGDVEIRGGGAARVSVRSTDGGIEFSGSIPAGGEVDLHSHGGDLRVHLPAEADLDVTVLPYSGDFESEFPVRTEGFRSGQPMEFTLGAGGAHLVLEAFSGDIELLRQ